MYIWTSVRRPGNCSDTEPTLSKSRTSRQARKGSMVHEGKQNNVLVLMHVYKTPGNHDMWRENGNDVMTSKLNEEHLG